MDMTEDRTDPAIPADLGSGPMQSLDDLSDETERAGAKTSPGRRSLLKSAGLWAFAISMFFLFLVLKLPEARIQNLVIAHIRIIAQEQGFLFSAEKVRVGLLLGPALKIYNAEFKAIVNERQVLKVPYLRVRPKLLSLVGSVKKAAITAELLEGELSGTLGASQTGAVYADLDLDEINLGATNVLRKFLPLDLTGVLDGRIKLDLDGADPTKSDGLIKLAINKLNAPAQNISGFNLPKISISESHLDIAINQGKIEFRQVELGKEGSQDDLIGKLTGEGTLSRALDRSTINAKATFSLSQGVKQSFPLLEAILGSAKTPDGKYAYRLTGSLSALEPTPGG